MTINKTMLKITALAVVIFSLTGCENDFDTLGGNIIGDPNFNADLYADAEIKAVTNSLSSVQTNNLPVNLLGVYQDPLFGRQKASILTQVRLLTPKPSFGKEPVLDSVVLNIPYFSTQQEAGEQEGTQYELDSVYGNSPIQLSVIESDFFLNQFDPETDFTRSQKYYSDMQPQIESNLTSNVLFETSNFVPSASEVIEFGINDEGDRDTIRSAPRMRLKLSTDFFQEKIINKEGGAELSSESNFRNYFRGIFLKVDEAGSDGSLALLNLNHDEAGITLYYTTGEQDTETEEMMEVNKTYRLGFGPGRVNTFVQDSPQFNDDKLYLKGGEGSMAVIDLFAGADADGDGVSDELEFLRDNDWLINEANLVFHVDRDAVAGLDEPERIYLYDLENNTILADYRLDSPGSTNVMNSDSNVNHLQPLIRDEEGRGISYKIRITSHINNILNNDADNVKLGLAVTQNVNLITNSAVRGSEVPEVERVPAGSVVTPKGTVLYGPDAENEEKRLRLRIYYTEPKN